MDLIKKILNKLPALSRLFFLRQNKKRIGSKNGPLLLLSFDCDNFEDIVAIEEIFNFLRINNIKATLAVPGEILLRGKEDFLKLHQGGHEFIGHGYKKHCQIINGKYLSTLYYNQLNDKEIEEDIIRGNEVIKNLFGYQPFGFRIPHFSRNKRELQKVYRILAQEGIKYSSSTPPLFTILKGPIFKSYYSIYEIPVSGGYYKPLDIFDTYNYGFSKDSNRDNFKDYLKNFVKLIDFYFNKNVCLNLYCDPSQAVQMREWFEAINYAKSRGYTFITLREFYERFFMPSQATR